MNNTNEITDALYVSIFKDLSFIPVIERVSKYEKLIISHREQNLDVSKIANLIHQHVVQALPQEDNYIDKLLLINVITKLGVGYWPRAFELLDSLQYSFPDELMQIHFHQLRGKIYQNASLFKAAKDAGQDAYALTVDKDLSHKVTSLFMICNASIGLGQFSEAFDRGVEIVNICGANRNVYSSQCNGGSWEDVFLVRAIDTMVQITRASGVYEKIIPVVTGASYSLCLFQPVHYGTSEFRAALESLYDTILDFLVLWEIPELNFIFGLEKSLRPDSQKVQIIEARNQIIAINQASTNSTINQLRTMGS
jgi:hypothetical protein